ncbi:MAG: glycosyltransferase family 2 protein [Bdellovibrionales bacterium]|nr:glycosyltransferase family 2 protein [Bdellovibrionales bacterium]
MPTFNRASVLPRALKSVLAQDFQDWELIVADDGSSDTTAEIVKDFSTQSGRGIYLSSRQNRGVSHARNQAARSARGEWLAFLDSDDEWLPHKLSTQIKLAEHYPLIHSEEIWHRHGVRVNATKKYAKSGGSIFERCVDVCCISPSTTLIRRDLFFALGGFREDFPVCEDYDLWLKVCAAHEVGYIPEALIVRHGGHADQLSMTYKAMDYFRAKALVPFLSDERVNRDYVAKSLARKCEILLKGYEKHSNFANYVEVEDWLRKARTALHTAHSTADRRPRSESSFSL